MLISWKKVAGKQAALSTAVTEEQTCPWSLSLQRLAATLGAAITAQGNVTSGSFTLTCPVACGRNKAAVLLGTDHYEPSWGCILHAAVKGLTQARYLLLPVVFLKNIHLLKCYKCAASWEPVGRLEMYFSGLWTIRHVSQYNVHNLIG